MSYMEQFKKSVENAEKSKNMPTVTKKGNISQVEYKREYNKNVEGKNQANFYYMIKTHAIPLFNGSNKTYVDVSYDDNIDIERYRTRTIPQEIVATVCGFNSYKDLYENIDNLPEEQQERIVTMLNAIVPISKEQYESIK